MFKSLLSSACLLVVLAGCASTAQQAVSTAHARSSTCLASGSRIPQTQGDCVSRGQSYTGDDLYQTGHPGDLGAALRQLDPAAH